MGAQQGNRFEWKTLLLNQSVHIGRNGRKCVLFERRAGKKKSDFPIASSEENSMAP